MCLLFSRLRNRTPVGHTSSLIFWLSVVPWLELIELAATCAVLPPRRISAPASCVPSSSLSPVTVHSSSFRVDQILNSAPRARFQTGEPKDQPYRYRVGDLVEILAVGEFEWQQARVVRAYGPRARLEGIARSFTYAELKLLDRPDRPTLHAPNGFYTAHAQTEPLHDEELLRPFSILLESAPKPTPAIPPLDECTTSDTRQHPGNSGLAHPPRIFQSMGAELDDESVASPMTTIHDTTSDREIVYINLTDSDDEDDSDGFRRVGPFAVAEPEDIFVPLAIVSAGERTRLLQERSTLLTSPPDGEQPMSPDDVVREHGNITVYGRHYARLPEQGWLHDEVPILVRMLSRAFCMTSPVTGTLTAARRIARYALARDAHFRSSTSTCSCCRKGPCEVALLTDSSIRTL